MGEFGALATVRVNWNITNLAAFPFIQRVGLSQLIEQILGMSWFAGCEDRGLVQLVSDLWLDVSIVG